MAKAKLQAEIGLDSGPFKQGINDVGKAVKGLATGDLAQLKSTLSAAFAGGSIVAFGKSVVDWASNASQAAANVGSLTSQMIGLNRAAIQVGLGVDEMAGMVGKLQNAIYDAGIQGGDAEKKFSRLGLSVTDLAALDPADALVKVAQAAIASGAELESLSDIFGAKLGPKMTDAMRMIATDGIPPVSQAVGDLADDVERMGDKWAVIGDKTKEWAMTAMSWIDKAHSRLVAFLGAAMAAQWDDMVKAAGGDKKAAARATAGLVGMNPNAWQQGFEASNNVGVQEQEQAEKAKEEKKLQREKHSARILSDFKKAADDRAAKSADEEARKRTAQIIKDDEEYQKNMEKQDEIAIESARQIADIKKADAAQPGTWNLPAADQFQKMGGVVGGQVTAEMGRVNRSEDLLKKINDVLEKSNEKLSQIALNKYTVIQ